MTATLLIAAHGTASPVGAATTHAIAAAVASARPELVVSLCFLDVVGPRLSEALDSLDGDVVVVPLLLSAGYHVTTDIPSIVAGRVGVRVAAHLGPDAMVVEAVADRLTDAGGERAATTVMAVVASTRASAQAEVETARSALANRLGRSVALLPLSADLRDAVAALPAPIAVAAYLLAEGTFLNGLRDCVGSRGVIAAPIGAHPRLVDLVLARFDDALSG